MKFLNPFASALWLAFTTCSLSSPVPTRPFYVSTYEAPFSLGQGLTGYNMTARNGNLYLSPKPKAPKVVMFVTGDGKAYLDSTAPQPVYIDTYNGLLAYASPAPPAPPGAIFVDFVHLGHGTSVLYDDGEETDTAPGHLEWLGQETDPLWYACNTTNGEYQVYKQMTEFGITPDTDECDGISLSALDYSGPNPAASSY